ncbi:amidohydrolase family protein, partial [uncultured Maricaulis sp.]|uniref:amidohydrolase family protein n=1 Tax=uncultured Maricaulis sp. TaxID=174710 RepID=UPI0030DDA2FE
MFDLKIEGGLVFDGTGGPAVWTDIGITGGRIAAIGNDIGDAKRTIDARGQIVTPGFIDVHTHYDGQASWDGDLRPSIDHGVTTA